MATKHQPLTTDSSGSLDITPDPKMAIAKKVITNMRQNILGVIQSEMGRVLDMARSKKLIGEGLVEKYDGKHDPREISREFLDVCVSQFMIDSSKFEVFLEIFRSIDSVEVVAVKIQEHLASELLRNQENSRSRSCPGGADGNRGSLGTLSGVSLTSDTSQPEEVDPSVPTVDLTSYEQAQCMLTSEKNQVESLFQRKRDAIRQMKENPQYVDSTDELSSEVQDSSENYEMYVKSLQKKEDEMKGLREAHEAKIKKLKQKVKDKDQENEELKVANTEYEDSIKKQMEEVVQLKTKANIRDKDFKMLRMTIEMAELKAAHAHKIAELTEAHAKKVSEHSEAHADETGDLRDEMKNLKEEIIELRGANSVLKEELNRVENEKLVGELEKEKKRTKELEERLKKAEKLPENSQNNQTKGRSEITGQPS